MTAPLTKQEYMLVIEALDVLRGRIEVSIASLHKTAKSYGLTNRDAFNQTLAEWETELALLESAKEKIHAGYVSTLRAKQS